MIEFLYLFGEYSLTLFYTLLFQPFLPNQVIYLPLLVLTLYYYNTINYLATGLLFAYSIKAAKQLERNKNYLGEIIPQLIGVKFNEEHLVLMPNCMTIYEYIYFDFKNHFNFNVKEISTIIIYLLFSVSRNVLIKHVMSSLIGLLILITIKYVQNYNNFNWFYMSYNETILYEKNYGKLLPYPVPIMVLASFIPDLYFYILKNNYIKLEQELNFSESSDSESSDSELSNSDSSSIYSSSLDSSESETLLEFSDENTKVSFDVVE